MKPEQIRRRRLELGLTVDEMAFALNLTEDELRRIESGLSDVCVSKAFDEAFECLEERFVGTFVGA